MANVMLNNLNRLYDKALEIGAARASLFSARNIVVDERARLKCLVPRCPYYDSLMCPPNLMSLDDFRRVLARYEHALLVQVEMGVSGKALREKYGDCLSLSELFQSPGYLEETTASCQTFNSLISRLEAEAFKLGYRFAAGFAAGNFHNALDKGKSPTSSDLPFTARPSMEAMGIDVFETARRAGLPIAFQAEEIDPYFNGLILVE
jgi:predicted metal-binding protein